ncbi:hypothetical protein A2U01_0073524, partial [Trifolium medium]|nr:hypothetical protein [Trifolium medium]
SVEDKLDSDFDNDTSEASDTVVSFRLVFSFLDLRGQVFRD